ncbi:unnamed protein product [Polarella glacialis]|uniref:MORN repeat-containing protein 5 n=1 Tax=Polarella glacialis TaxID=89957 RepID=A0A813FP30_POLGL|nr:unnamed protein product [Polarella glacialis]
MAPVMDAVVDGENIKYNWTETSPTITLAQRGGLDLDFREAVPQTPMNFTRSLDEHVEVDNVNDLKVMTREFPDGRGTFSLLHHQHLSKSMMSGVFESVSSAGGVTRYEGTFHGDPHQDGPVPNGQGVRTNPDGSTYSGQWKDGFPHGTGEWKAAEPSTESFVGEWQRGKKHGFGIMKFANGDCYEGDWFEGKFQDRGKYIYANKDEFMGLWEKGVKVSGTFYYKDGRISTRKWQNGKLISCQEFDARKKVYHPTMTHAQAHDPERTSYGNQTVFSGNPMLSPSGIRPFS